MSKRQKNPIVNEIRLQKYLADCGIASRRKCEEFIEAGHVKVNGNVILKMGVKIDPNKDTVHYLNKLVQSERKVYLIINKPKDYITTCDDPKNRKKVLDLLPTEYKGLHPVGRLDRKTTGLLIMTNDGELTQTVLHPKYKIQKTYKATLNKSLKLEDAKKISEGIMLEGRKTLPAELKILDVDAIVIELNIKEGRNRQIRKMFELLKYDVIKLKRTRIGFLALGNLKLSEYRLLKASEVARIQQWGEKGLKT